MNDATNRFVNVETGKAMFQRTKKKTTKVSTPTDKLTMSDLDAKRKQNNSMHKKNSVEPSGTNLGQYLFGGSGSGDEMSLASSVNSTSSTSSSLRKESINTNSSPLLKVPSSDATVSSMKISVSPSRELGTFEPEATNAVCAMRSSPTEDALKTSSILKPTMQNVSPEEFMWQSYAPDAQGITDSAKSDNFQTSQESMEKKSDMVGAVIDNNKKPQFDVIDTLNIENVQCENDSKDLSTSKVKASPNDSHFGWVSHVPGESGAFVSGDEAMQILDDGEASFESEHKFSLRKSFVASSFSKSNSVNQESLGMIENDHIWGASGASGESNIDGEINSNSISNRRKEKDSAVVNTDEHRNVDERSWQKSAAKRLPRTQEEKEAVQNYFIERSMPLGHIVDGNATRSQAVRFNDTQKNMNDGPSAGTKLCNARAKINTNMKQICTKPRDAPNANLEAQKKRQIPTFEPSGKLNSVLLAMMILQSSTSCCIQPVSRRYKAQIVQAENVLVTT